MIGLKYGKLLVLEASERRDSSGGIFYLCQCDCGTVKDVSKNKLKRGHTRSCGCLNTFNREKKQRRLLLPGEALFNKILYSYKSSAIKRKIDWQISNDIAIALLKGSCFYCGSPPCRLKDYKRLNGKVLFNGIDRVNNNIGYIEENLVSCCSKCNFAKHTMSLEEFKNHVTKIYNFICRE
jgi:hypothetical protein